MHKEYRIDVKVRNNLILQKIEQAGYSNVGEFCRKHDLTLARVYSIVNMKESPLDFRGNFHSSIIKMAEILNCSPENFFTESQLHAELKTNKRTLFVNEAEAKFISNSSNDPLLPDESIAKEKLNESLLELLGTLTAKEATVLKLRFGLDGEAEHTKVEIAKIVNVVPARVRQIEDKALRKLRHDSRADVIRDHLE